VAYRPAANDTLNGDTSTNYDFANTEYRYGKPAERLAVPLARQETRFHHRR
jgi:hypothetical protein